MYHRAKKYDRRLSWGDQFDGDAWTTRRNEVHYIVVGKDPNIINPDYITLMRYISERMAANGNITEFTHCGKIQSVIDTIDTARENKKRLNMGVWQSKNAKRPYPCVTFDDFIQCNSACCFAGYVALNPVFQAHGGRANSSSGGPFYNLKYGPGAISEYFGWNKQFANMVCFIPHYPYHSSKTMTPYDFYDVACVQAVSFENLLDKLRKIQYGQINPFQEMKYESSNYS